MFLESKKRVIVSVIVFIIIEVIWVSGLLSLTQPKFGGVDQSVYNQSVINFFSRQDMYSNPNEAVPEDWQVHNYPPVSVFLVGLLSLLPLEVLYALHFLAVLLLFLCWKKIFRRNGIEFPLWITPIWFVFSSFLYDAATLNVNTFLALLATLSIFLYREKTTSAKIAYTLALFLLIITKPQWGIFVLLPLAQGKWKDVFTHIAGVAVLYVLLSSIACRLTDLEYIIRQHLLYIAHLSSFARRFPRWDVPPEPYKYNNSLHQVIIYLVGSVDKGLLITKFVQIALFSLLGIVFFRTMYKKNYENSSGQNSSDLKWFFILYCVVLLYPPQNYDFSLGIAMCVFLAAQGKYQKILIGIPFFFLAVQDIISGIMILLGVPGWFPFIFTCTAISLFLLLFATPNLANDNQTKDHTLKAAGLKG